MSLGVALGWALKSMLRGSDEEMPAGISQIIRLRGSRSSFARARMDAFNVAEKFAPFAEGNFPTPTGNASWSPLNWKRRA